jgi:peptidyl-prolyl cis-trans isomerase SurA
LIDGLKWKKGITYIDNKNGSYTIARITEILPAGAKTLNEVKGIMTGEYQNVLEANWIATLKTKFPVKINEAAVKSIMN